MRSASVPFICWLKPWSWFVPVSRLVAILSMAATLAPPAHAAPAGLQITVPAADLLVGDRITTAAWPDHVIRTPDEDGQFEVLVRKTAVSKVDAAACRSSWLLVRMPAVLPPVDADYHPQPRDPTNQRKLDAARAEYAALQADVTAGRPATFQVDGAGYASKTRHGLKLSGCNLFFSMGGG